MSVTAAVWEGRTPAEWRDAWAIPSLLILDAIGSTNDSAMRLAADGAPAGATVIADTQMLGRGSAGRRWFDSPGKSLLMSVVLRADTEPADPSTIPLRTGLAVANAIESLTSIGARVKWPNDVLDARDRKIAGILCEGASGAGSAWLIAGIGINVSQQASDFDPERAPLATSIAELGGTATRPELAGRILDLLRPFLIVPPPLDDATLRELDRRDALRGRTVMLNESIACTAAGIEADGALRVIRDGIPVSIRSGSIRLAGLRSDTPHAIDPGE